MPTLHPRPTTTGTASGNEPEQARGKPDPASANPAMSGARPRRAHPPTTPTSTRPPTPAVQRPPVPATVWPPPPGAVGPAWEQWIQLAIRRAFLPPGCRLVDLTTTLTHPVAADDPRSEPATGRRSVRLAPFWAHLIASDTTTRSSGSHEHEIAAGHDGAESDAPEPIPSPGPDAARRQADVVYADLRNTTVDDRLGLLAARALGGGGVLVVLTRSHIGADGELVDPTGMIVASAQNADLLYLQHIVVPTAPLAPPFRPPRLPEPSTGDGQSPMPEDGRARRDDPAPARGHSIAHVDLLAFARPRPRGSSGSVGWRSTPPESLVGAKR